MSRRTQLSRLSVAALLLGPVCVQCSSPTAADPLVRFETCTELQVFLEDRILHPQQTQSPGFSVVGCSSDGAAPSIEGEGEGEGERQRTFTTTNTQEVDVDEPDFVKNDGDDIFVLRRGRMIIVDAWPPEQAHIVSETEIPGVPFTMFFDGDTRAMVFSRLNDTFPSTTLVSLFDVSDRAAPALARELSIDARFVDARRIGNDVLLVTRSDVAADFELRTEAFSEDENRARLRQIGVDGLLPRVSDRRIAADGSVDESVGPAFACGDAYAPQHTPSTALLIAHSISIVDPGATVHSTAIVGTPGAVYASTSNLYLIGTETYDGGHFTPNFSVTRIHKLGAAAAGRAPYLGGAVLEGRVKNELSVDEDVGSGTLRVVLTLNDDGNGDPRANQSALVVLDEGDDLQLHEIARVNDIGHGEEIESVRFVGDRAYVATFPAAEGPAFDNNGFPRVAFLDPLFVVDLADPRDPHLRGAVEVDGYSAYIHPIDADHLLTVGVRVDDGGAFDGLQLSIFDVSDLDAPTLTQRFLFGDQNSGTEALVERHAFTYFDERKTLALPFQRLEEEVVGESALLVFDVDVDRGFTLAGAMDQLPLYVSDLSSFSADDALCGAVRRSVIINDPELGAFVYAVSTAGITVAPLNDGVDLVARVAFRSAEICDFSGTPL